MTPCRRRWNHFCKTRLARSSTYQAAAVASDALHFIKYAYDEVGNQTSITYPDGSKVSNFYDAVYNLTSVIDAGNGTYVYIYDASNRPVKLTYPNGWVEQYTYNAEGNLLKTVDTDPFQLYSKTPKVKYEYTYDAECNIPTEFQQDSDSTENLMGRTAILLAHSLSHVDMYIGKLLSL